MDAMRPSVLFVVGPTSSGKTALGLSLAKRFDGEVVNADARQVYSGAPIGTGIPPGVWDRGVYLVEGIPHHLMKGSSEDDVWTVPRWCGEAKACLAGIFERGRLPIVVGGTGLYIRALAEGYVFSGAPDESRRTALLELSPEERVRRLCELDPGAAEMIDLRNPHRVLRALERALGGQVPPSAAAPDFRVLKIARSWPDDALRQRVAAAVEEKFATGWIDEVRGLLEAGVSLEAPLMRSVGFGPIIAALRSAEPFSEESLRAIVERETWQYVRRQRTWFRKEPGLRWIDTEDEAAQVVTGWLAGAV